MLAIGQNRARDLGKFGARGDTLSEPTINFISDRTEDTVRVYADGRSGIVGNFRKGRHYAVWSLMTTVALRYIKRQPQPPLSIVRRNSMHFYDSVEMLRTSIGYALPTPLMVEVSFRSWTIDEVLFCLNSGLRWTNRWSRLAGWCRLESRGGVPCYLLHVVEKLKTERSLGARGYVFAFVR
jgi:hypothetical protein